MKAQPAALADRQGRVDRRRRRRGDLRAGRIAADGAKSCAQLLEREGYSAAVINPRFVKPLDRELLERLCEESIAIVTFEDHVLMGGFGSAVLEALSDMDLNVPVVRIGWPDQFIEHGKVEQLARALWNQRRGGDGEAGSLSEAD